MYLEVIECLNDINRSIYGLPVIWSIIGSNVSQVVFLLYYGVLFRVIETAGFVPYFTIITVLTRLFNVMLLYGVGDATEKEVFIVFLIPNKLIT